MEMPGPQLHSCTHLCCLIVECWNTGATQQPERVQYLGLFAHVHICTQIPNTFTYRHACTLSAYTQIIHIPICTHTLICMHRPHMLLSAHRSHTCLHTNHTHSYAHRSHTFTSAHTLWAYRAYILTSAYRSPTFMSTQRLYTLISVHTPFCTKTIHIHICIHITILIYTHTDHKRSCVHMLITHTLLSAGTDHACSCFIQRYTHSCSCLHACK